MLSGSNALREAIADAVEAAIEASTLRLYKSDVTPNPLTAIGDMVECDFVGYAGILSAAAIVQVDSGTGEIVVSLDIVPAFTAGAIVAPQDAIGWYMTNTGKTIWYAARRFDQPLHFAANGDGYVLDDVAIRIPLAAVTG